MLAKVFYDTDHHFQYEIRSMKGDIDVTTVDPHGPNPKELVLAALCGCTGTDMVDLMKKFGVVYESFSLSAGASLTDHHPKRFVSIDLAYYIRGVGIEIVEIVEAAKRSMHQYSGTAAMLSRACPIKYKVHLNDVVVGEGEASFETY
jgi:putative redox protein